MNIHHLELFYYVARHRGISAAVRHMPYGIQQPAVSSQILRLEQDLGTRLFERTPFQLSAAGAKLFAFIQPFFENLDGVAAELRKGCAPVLRMGAVELVMHDHLHSVIERLREHHPRIQLSLRSGFTPQLETWLLERQIDVAFAPLEGKLPPRIRALKLLRMPLVLVVPRTSKIKSAAELWARDTPPESLITLPPGETITRLFRKGLQKRRIEWPTAIEASSLQLVTRYVASGYGIGLNVAAFPGEGEVRALPLPGFDPMVVAVLWHGEPTPLVRMVVEESARYVRATFPEWCCKEESL